MNISAPDRELWRLGKVVAGMDEVGRGPLAGPVAVACVVMPAEPLIPYVNDSKKVSEKRREQLAKEIKKSALACSISWMGPDVIDAVNILEATKRAFETAFQSIDYPVNDVMIDALSGLRLNAEQHVMIHGDALCYSIAAASIVAKTARDAYMREQDVLYPEYGFARNKGYGTAEHIAALKKYGPCPIHRKSFIQHFV